MMTKLVLVLWLLKLLLGRLLKLLLGRFLTDNQNNFFLTFFITFLRTYVGYSYFSFYLKYI